MNNLHNSVGLDWDLTHNPHHAQIQKFFREGDQGPKARKQYGHFFSPQLILQFTEGVQRFYYRENYTFPRIQRGSNILRVGGQTFSRGGPNANFYRNPYNLWFSRGVRTPYPPSRSAHAWISNWTGHQLRYRTLHMWAYKIKYRN